MTCKEKATGSTLGNLNPKTRLEVGHNETKREVAAVRWQAFWRATDPYTASRQGPHEIVQQQRVAHGETFSTACWNELADARRLKSVFTMTGVGSILVWGRWIDTS